MRKSQSPSSMAAMEQALRERKAPPAPPPIPPAPPTTPDDAPRADPIADMGIDSDDGIHVVTKTQYVETCMKALRLAGSPVNRWSLVRAVDEYLSNRYPDWQLAADVGQGAVLKALCNDHGVTHKCRLGKVDGKQEYVVDTLTL